MAENMMPGGVPLGKLPISPQATPGPEIGIPIQPGTPVPAVGPNPLEKYFRQPKIYITLPSKGAYWPPGSIEMPENGELPVYAMTAKDEMRFKTPDALMNGQATVDVIQSCFPNIKNAWVLPILDLDTLLIAMRIATYGETLELTSPVPVTGEDKAFSIDMRTILDKFINVSYDNVVTHSGLNITIQPLTYLQFTKTALKSFEEQRIFQTVQDKEMPEDEKISTFNASFAKLTSLTIDVIKNSIAQIQVDGQIVVDVNQISEFIDKADKEFYAAITAHIDVQKKKFEVEPMRVESSEEEQKQGVPKTYEVPIAFDQSNFFVSGS